MHYPFPLLVKWNIDRLINRDNPWYADHVDDDESFRDFDEFKNSMSINVACWRKYCIVLVIVDIMDIIHPVFLRM